MQGWCKGRPACSDGNLPVQKDYIVRLEDVQAHAAALGGWVAGGSKGRQVGPHARARGRVGRVRFVCMGVHQRDVGTTCGVIRRNLARPTDWFRKYFNARARCFGVESPSYRMTPKFNCLRMAWAKSRTVLKLLKTMT